MPTVWARPVEESDKGKPNAGSQAAEGSTPQGNTQPVAIAERGEYPSIHVYTKEGMDR